MRTILLMLSLLLATTTSWALCPVAETISADGDAPVVSLAPTKVANRFVITVKAKQPACFTLLEVIAQSAPRPVAPLRLAALSGGPTETPAALGRASHGMTRFIFLVDSWLPAGETRYELWFEVGPVYVALDPGLSFWFRTGATALPARLEVASWGVPTKPPRAAKRDAAIVERILAKKPAPQKVIKRKRR